MTEEGLRQDVLSVIKRNKEFLSKDLEPNSLGTAMMDGQLVSAIANAMTVTLAESRKKGWAGWWSDDVVTLDSLEQQLSKHLAEGDQIAAINLLAMIWIRKGSLTTGN